MPKRSLPALGQVFSAENESGSKQQCKEGDSTMKGIRSGKELVKFKCQDCYKIFFSIDDSKKHEKEHKSEENDFMNEHEGKIYEEKCLVV